MQKKVCSKMIAGSLSILSLISTISYGAEDYEYSPIPTEEEDAPKPSDYSTSLVDFEQDPADECLENGIILFNKRDYLNSLSAFSIVAENNAKAAFIMGCIYRKGYGIPTDYNEAKKWYELAFDLGYEEAIEPLICIESVLNSIILQFLYDKKDREYLMPTLSIENGKVCFN
jgi:TPR repeat protein